MLNADEILLIKKKDQSGLLTLTPSQYNTLKINIMEYQGRIRQLDQ